MSSNSSVISRGPPERPASVSIPSDKVPESAGDLLPRCVSTHPEHHSPPQGRGSQGNHLPSGAQGHEQPASPPRLLPPLPFCTAAGPPAQAGARADSGRGQQPAGRCWRTPGGKLLEGLVDLGGGRWPDTGCRGHLGGGGDALALAPPRRRLHAAGDRAQGRSPYSAGASHSTRQYRTGIELSHLAPLVCFFLCKSSLPTPT